MRLEFNILGGRAVSRDLIGISRRAVDLTPGMEEALDLIRAANLRQFDSQGQYGSGGWRPILATTRWAKQKAGLDPRILHATHALRDSLTEKGNSDQVAIARVDGLDFGTTVEYALAHQHGVSERRLPRRPPVQFPESVRGEIVTTIQRHLMHSVEDRMSLRVGSIL